MNLCIEENGICKLITTEQTTTSISREESKAKKSIYTFKLTEEPGKKRLKRFI